MENLAYDVAIIGAGVTGCAVARELSRYDLKACVLEQGEDVCCGTSKANSAIVHAGHDAVPGTWKARFNLEGNRMMEELSRELDFEFVKNGSLVLCLDEEDLPALYALCEKGKENGVEGLEILPGSRVREMEPNVSKRAVAALYAPSGGIVCPFGLTIALAENACDNGVDFLFGFTAKTVRRAGNGYEIEGTAGKDGWRMGASGKAQNRRGTAGAAGDRPGADGAFAACHGSAGTGLAVTARYVVNAAGVYADTFHNMVSSEKIHITARKGEYCLLDKEAGEHVHHTIFQLPGHMGKGVLVTPTVHGNLLLGPTAEDVENRGETATTAPGLAAVTEKAAAGVDGIPFRQVITSFAGLRAHEDGDDFVIGEPSDAPGFFDAAGIESPGLTSAPAIGVYLAEQIAAASGAEKKTGWNGKRCKILRPQELDRSGREQLIRERPEYGDIICRCEGVSEGEILDAIHRSLGAVSLDGIKRRVRQGMGRCQAGFCTPRTMEILARERGVALEEICKNEPGSRMLAGRK